MSSRGKPNASQAFDKGYVLRITTKHMRKAIQTSIDKTFERIPAFADDLQKSAEVFETLAELHAMRKVLDQYQAANAEKFKRQ